MNIVLGGDFSQILPIVPKGKRGQIVNSLSNTYIYGVTLPYIDLHKTCV
jgi:hypothetical protein